MRKLSPQVWVALVAGAVALAIGTIGWEYRTQLRNAYRAFIGELPPGGMTAGPGRPSEPALLSARRKHAMLARGRGPVAVELSASEMASLIVAQLDPVTRAALDSLTVTLDDDRFTLEAILVTEVWGRQVLGPLSGFLEPREPLRVAGPARIRRRGVVAWHPDEFVIKSIPFPRTAVSFIVNSLTGGSDGAILLPAPRTVETLRIQPERVTFFRRGQ